MIIDLARELQKPEYSNLTDAQALAALQVLTVAEPSMIPATTVNQLFAALDLTGEIQDIAADIQHPLRHKMASVLLSIGGNHEFNFINGTSAGNGNLQMLDGMIAGLPDLAAKLTQFKTTVHQLANFKRRFASVSLEDVIAARAAQLDGQWHELPETDGRTLTLQLNSRTPEVTHIAVQMQDLSGEWEHATALHGIQSAKPYSAPLPYYGQARKVWWRCEYALDGVVAVL